MHVTARIQLNHRCRLIVLHPFCSVSLSHLLYNEVYTPFVHYGHMDVAKPGAVQPVWLVTLTYINIEANGRVGPGNLRER